MSPVSPVPHSKVLAGFLAKLRVADLPADAVNLLKLCLLDTIGCAMAGRGTEVGTAMERFHRTSGGGGPCSVFGSGAGAGAETAALVNGVLAHALVFDDLHRHAKLHPGVVAVPAGWAMAELAHTDGATLLAALAAGYEATARIGVAVGMASHRKRGWRATGTAGSFGAAAAAARAAALDAAAFHDALAMAAAQASGTWAFQESAGMELYLAAGTAARNGVVAALLAESGVKGANDPLMAQDGGFLNITSDAPDPRHLSDGLGARFRLLDTCIKMYPTCHSSQTAIDAAMNLRSRHAVTLGDIERVEVRAGEITRLQCGWPYEPSPPPRLIFHMGYAMALAIRNGEVRPADFEGAMPLDPELMRLARATEVIADPEFTAIYAECKPSDVTLYLRDGRALRERVDYCRGEPENPPTVDIVMKKFKTLTGDVIDASIMEEIADRILAIEREPDLSRLRRLVAR